MSLYTICPTCSTGYDLHETQRGKRVICKACNAAFLVQEPLPASAATAVGDVYPTAMPVRGEADAPSHAGNPLLEAEPYRVEGEPPLALPAPAPPRPYDWDDLPPRPPRYPEPAGMSPAVLVPLIVVPIVVVVAVVLLICLVSQPSPFNDPPRRVIVAPPQGFQNPPLVVPPPPRFNLPPAPPRFNPGRPAPGRIR